MKIRYKNGEVVEIDNCDQCKECREGLDGYVYCLEDMQGWVLGVEPKTLRPCPIEVKE